MNGNWFACSYANNNTINNTLTIPAPAGSNLTLVSLQNNDISVLDQVDPNANVSAIELRSVAFVVLVPVLLEYTGDLEVQLLSCIALCSSCVHQSFLNVCLTVSQQSWEARLRIVLTLSWVLFVVDLSRLGMILWIISLCKHDPVCIF